MPWIVPRWKKVQEKSDFWDESKPWAIHEILIMYIMGHTVKPWLMLDFACVSMGFLHILQFPSTVQNHAFRSGLCSLALKPVGKAIVLGIYCVKSVTLFLHCTCKVILKHSILLHHYCRIKCLHKHV